MQEPTEEVEASISTENVRDGPNLNNAFTGRRKAAKRTFPWDLAAGEVNPESPPRAEDIPVKKKRRLEKSFSASIDKAATKISSHDTAVSANADADADADYADADADDADADADRMKGTRSASAYLPSHMPQSRVHWRQEEDAKLNNAVKNTCKKKCGQEYKTDWTAVAALVPGRTRNQCWSRWKEALDPNIDRASAGKWTEDEDSKLKRAVQTHGGKNWYKIAKLVPGRAQRQCRSRWHNVLNVNVDRMPGRTGTWTAVEVNKLKCAVQTHGDKNWGEVAALVPGRTRDQCLSKWKNVLDSNIDRPSRRTGKWTAVEVSKLKFAVQMHGAKDWAAIATLVPGRTRGQCWSRWKDVLDPKADRASGRTGKWTAVEDSKLKFAVRTYDGKNWAAIAALVPGRAQIQCRSRWHNALDANSDQTPGRTGTWTEEEIVKLKSAVQMHGEKDWVAISALVLGRTKKQCWDRWKKHTDPARVDTTYTEVKSHSFPDTMSARSTTLQTYGYL
jgi:hypothetical protein